LHQLIKVSPETHTATMSKPNSIEKINPPNIVPPKPTYSHVTAFSTSQPSKIISIAGQTGVKPGGVLPSTMDEQVKLALDKSEAMPRERRRGPKGRPEDHALYRRLRPQPPGMDEAICGLFLECDPPASNASSWYVSDSRNLGDDLCRVST
jgi:hypothetical protein